MIYKLKNGFIYFGPFLTETRITVTIFARSDETKVTGSPDSSNNVFTIERDYFSVSVTILSDYRNCFGFQYFQQFLLVRFVLFAV